MIGMSLPPLVRRIRSDWWTAAVAIVLGEWQMLVRSPLHRWLDNPEHYYRSVTAHGTGFGDTVGACERPFPNDLALMRREPRQHRQHQPTGGGTRIKLLGHRADANTELLKFGDGI